MFIVHPIVMVRFQTENDYQAIELYSIVQFVYKNKLKKAHFNTCPILGSKNKNPINLVGLCQCLRLFQFNFMLFLSFSPFYRYNWSSLLFCWMGLDIELPRTNRRLYSWKANESLVRIRFSMTKNEPGTHIKCIENTNVLNIKSTLWLYADAICI